MADINVDHWRNMQALLLESAKAKRRIILIHENGELLKFVHSQKAEIVRNVERVDDPHAVAEKVYRANPGKADFVAVFERRAFDRYFAQFQDTWQADEDLDEFVHRQYALMDQYPDGIVTYPGPARTQLGLQWRVGASYEEVLAAVNQFVPPNSTVLFGIFEGDSLWATLVLGFDADRRAKVVTTVDPMELPPAGPWKGQAKALVDWVNRKHAPCSIGLFGDLAGAKELLASHDKPKALRTLAAAGRLLADPAPGALAKLVAPA
jgi:hypothetical protein